MPSARGFWFFGILIFCWAANPGASSFEEKGIQINKPIQCDYSLRQSDGEMKLMDRFFLEEFTSASDRKVRFQDGREVTMKCFWVEDVYRCQWNSWYFVELRGNQVWSPPNFLGQKWLYFTGSWQRGVSDEQPANITCKQNISKIKKASLDTI